MILNFLKPHYLYITIITMLKFLMKSVEFLKQQKDECLLTNLKLMTLIYIKSGELQPGD